MSRAAPWPPALSTLPLGSWALCLLHGSLIPSGSRSSFLRGSLYSLQTEPQKNIRCIHSKPGDRVFRAAKLQCCRARLASRPPPWPLPLSGVHPHFLLVLVPALLPGPCFSSPHLGKAPPKPFRMYSPWGWRGVCGVLHPTASLGAVSVSRDPNTWLPGGAAPCAGSRRGTASDWHVPPPGTPAWGGGGRKGKRGREERKGGELEGSLRQRLGFGWVLEHAPPPTSAPNSSPEREGVRREEDDSRKTKSPERERRRIQGDKHPHPMHTDSAAHADTLTKAHSVSSGSFPDRSLESPSPRAPRPDTHARVFTCLFPSRTPCTCPRAHPPTHPAPHPALPPRCEGVRFLLFGNDTLGLT